jgi:phage baseplate assembly protein W
MPIDIEVVGTLEKIVVGATGLAEILQNVRTILSTVRGTVPLDRAFGIDGDMVDAAQPVVRARLAADVVASIERYEPRVTVTAIDWREIEADGRMVPAVGIQLKEGVVV